MSWANQAAAAAATLLLVGFAFGVFVGWSLRFL